MFYFYYRKRTFKQFFFFFLNRLNNNKTNKHFAIYRYDLFKTVLTFAKRSHYNKFYKSEVLV